MEYKVWHFLLTTQTPFVQHDESGQKQTTLMLHLDAHLQKVAAMKPTMLLMITVFLIFPAIFSGRVAIQFSTVGKRETTVLQDLRKICTPQASLSDEAWKS